MRIIAIEGASFAGKTTTIAALKSHPAIAEAKTFCCYVDELDQEDIPPVRPETAAGQLDAFTTFMHVEAQRVACVDELADHENPLIILDRSVDTLLAHAYALDRLLGYEVHRRVRARIQVLPHLRPDLTIYIDTPINTLTARRARQGHPAELYFLHDPEFLRHTREYFLTAPVPRASNRIITVNGNNTPDAIAAYVAAVVEHEWSRA